MSDDKIEVVTRTVEVRGIVLPWRRNAAGAEESGEVFILLETLGDLAEQDVWDSQFGSALLLAQHEGWALEQAGMAVHETKGGYHRTQKLLDFMRSIGER